MKNILDVLKQKELEKARVEREVECLRIVAPLLEDDKPRFVTDEEAEGMAATLQPAESEKKKLWP